MSGKALIRAIRGENRLRPPVWLMRQAGRYHRHYQELRKAHMFVDLCKKPDLACEVAMGPMRDFDFDAAILFSDLLFPLEAMGMGLEYDPAPRLAWRLKEPRELGSMGGGAELVGQLEFQAEALAKTRATLDREGFLDRALLGFVGSPFTLFVYAVQGSHQGDYRSVLEAVNDGRWEGFVERAQPLMSALMSMQAQAGADAIAIMDTAAGEVPFEIFQQKILPVLARTIDGFRSRTGKDFPLLYYSRSTGPKHWKPLEDLEIQAIGVDWREPLVQVMRDFSGRFSVQGNFDPEKMLLPREKLERELRGFFESARSLPDRALDGWVCGLGHGVLKETPEENVRLFVALEKEYFSDRGQTR